MTSELGRDLSSLDDVDETRVVSDAELVAQDVIWRLKTPRANGILAADAPDYGLDLLEEIGSADTEGGAASLPDRIRSELRKDERISSVVPTVTQTVEGPVTAYDIRIRCETSKGPFELVGRVDDTGLNLAVKLLAGGI
jgi:hypothetical protein